MATNLTNHYISQSFQRLLQVSPTDNKTLLNGTGSNHANLRISGALEVTDDVRIGGDLYVSGNIWFGDINTDSIAFVGQVSSSILPKTNNTYDIGSVSKKWRTVYASTFSGSFSGTVTATNLLGTINKIPRYTGTGSMGVSIMHQSASTIVITGSFLPEAKSTRNLGSLSKLWNSAYLNNIVFSSSFSIKSGSAEIIYIDKNRYVGINTSSPNHYVHLNQLSGQIDMVTVVSSSGATSFNIDRNGKVGIGLRASDTTFTLFNPRLVCENTTGYKRASQSGIAFFNAAHAGYGMAINDGASGDTTLRWIDGGSGQFMLWDFTNHYFGIRVTPTATFHVKSLGSTSANFAVKIQNVNNVPLFFVRDDGTTIVSGSIKAGLTASTIHEITGSIRISGSFRLKNGSQGTGKLLVSDISGSGTWSNKLTGSLNLSGSFYAQNIRTGGSTATPIIAKNGNYNIVIKDDMILGNATGSQITQTLPLTHTVPTGSEFTILKTDASVNKVVVAGNGKNINGVPNYDLNAQWDSITVKTDGMHWYIK